MSELIYHVVPRDHFLNQVFEGLATVTAEIHDLTIYRAALQEIGDAFIILAPTGDAVVLPFATRNASL